MLNHTLLIYTAADRLKTHSFKLIVRDEHNFSQNIFFSNSSWNLLTSPSNIEFLNQKDTIHYISIGIFFAFPDSRS